jgi:hypothetical protein
MVKRNRVVAVMLVCGLTGLNGRAKVMYLRENIEYQSNQ